MNSLFILLTFKSKAKLLPAALLFILFFNSLVSNEAISNNQLSDTQLQLDKISKSVQRIETEIAKNVKNHEVVKKALLELDQQVGKLHNRIRDSKAKISAGKKDYEQLKAKKAQLDRDLIEQGDLFKQQIRMAYTTQGQSKWKLLLSQSSLQNASKNAVIYDYLHEARINEINQINQLTEEIRSNQRDIENQQASLKELLDQLSKEEHILKAARQQKEQSYTKLEQTIQTDQASLKAEQNKKKRLQKLLKQLKKDESERTKGEFAHKVGKLDWPVKGKLRHRFGEQRAGIQWNGVSIKADRGAKVHAIFAGTVVFADWFDHYGWLLIIDHGGDYMSLYAHAEGLYKNEGDYVTQGELIAVVGDSGDVDQTGLYFEIRRQGTPVDPAAWCVHPKIAYSLDNGINAIN